jgi:hypothetical protein
VKSSFVYHISSKRFPGKYPINLKPRQQQETIGKTGLPKRWVAKRF